MALMRPDDILKRPLDQLELPEGIRQTPMAERIRYALRYAAKSHFRMVTVEDMCRKSAEQLTRRYARIGPKTVKILEEAVRPMGLKIGMTPDEIDRYRKG